jgi:hypothetical protein
MQLSYRRRRKDAARWSTQTRATCMLHTASAGCGISLLPSAATAGKGKRFIILHAMAKGGLLCKRDAEGKPVEVSNVMEEEAESAEFVFADLKMQEDYHQTMDGGTFMAWVENRLVPAYKSLYPDRPMALVLDNAPYHHAHEKGWRSPTLMNKLELVAWRWWSEEWRKSG